MRFGSLTIDFDDRILRPRPWTIAQSRWAAEIVADNEADTPSGPVLELCSGAGHIGLALIAETRRPLVQVDIDPHACAFARDNAAAAGLSALVDVRNGPMDHVLAADEEFGLIIADPPWVRSVQTSRFPDDPLIAIDGGGDGLDVARLSIEVIGGHLAADGIALVQLGTADQVSAIEPFALRHGLRADETRHFGSDGVLVRFDRGD